MYLHASFLSFINIHQQLCATNKSPDFKYRVSGNGHVQDGLNYEYDWPENEGYSGNKAGQMPQWDYHLGRNDGDDGDADDSDEDHYYLNHDSGQRSTHCGLLTAGRIAVGDYLEVVKKPLNRIPTRVHAIAREATYKTPSSQFSGKFRQ